MNIDLNVNDLRIISFTLTVRAAQLQKEYDDGHTSGVRLSAVRLTLEKIKHAVAQQEAEGERAG